MFWLGNRKKQNWLLFFLPDFIEKPREIKLGYFRKIVLSVLLDAGSTPAISTSTRQK